MARLQAHEVPPIVIQVRHTEEECREDSPWRCTCIRHADVQNNDPINIAQRKRFGQRRRRVKRLNRKEHNEATH